MFANCTKMRLYSTVAAAALWLFVCVCVCLSLCLLVCLTLLSPYPQKKRKEKKRKTRIKEPVHILFQPPRIRKKNQRFYNDDEETDYSPVRSPKKQAKVTHTASVNGSLFSSSFHLINTDEHVYYRTPCWL